MPERLSASQTPHACLDRRRWLLSAPLDLLFLFAPVWIVWAIAFALPWSIITMPLPLWMWVAIVLCVDVCHVWSTIFRTYLDRDERARRGALLWWTPALCLIGALALALSSLALYWRVMAYLALYHFIKQQFGFMALYQARLRMHGRAPRRKKFFNDKFVIYSSMLYPVAYWHLHRDEFFGWFVDGDFINLRAVVDTISPWAVGDLQWASFYTVANTLFWMLLLAWLIEEVIVHRRERLPLPIGKLLWVLTTGVNWYLGIVYFGSELVFSMTNMIAHGVPYLALIFVYVERKRRLREALHTPRELPRPFSTRIVAVNIALMLALIFVIALVEEYFWDLLINRNKAPFFESLLAYPRDPLDYPSTLAAIAIAILSLPQLTHYFLDGFIWKGRDNPHVKHVILDP